MEGWACAVDRGQTGNGEGSRGVMGPPHTPPHLQFRTVSSLTTLSEVEPLDQRELEEP